MNTLQQTEFRLAGTPTHRPSVASDTKLMNAARDLEATFLSEMLKCAGFGKLPESFGGGIGEEQFTSLLTDAQARGMVDRGGIGLAEMIFDSLKETSNEL